jgi:asparagine synthase (glutamine-hydrolysing)
MDALRLLNGAFSGVILDLREQKIVLFNDRYGLGRIYYHENGEGFYFASEAKALLTVLPQLRQLDLNSWGEFFACGCVLQDRSLFTGISLLPSGSAWTFRCGQTPEKKFYFDRTSWENQPALSELEYYEKLKETFGRVLPRYLTSKQGVGLSLTGGLDTRMIAAWAAPVAGTLPCYTFGGSYRDPADVTISRKVARLVQQDHRVINVDREFFKQFPALAKESVYRTDGAMDVGGSVELFVNRQARQIAPIRLTGNYGSEILRGSVNFKPDTNFLPILDHGMAGYCQTAGKTYGRELNGNRLSFIAFKQVPWFHYSRFALEQTLVVMRSPFLDNELVALAYRGPSELGQSRHLAGQLIHDGNPALAKVPADRGPLGRPGLIGKLRQNWQEFTFKAEYAYDYGMPQWLARIDRLFAPCHFERLFLGRHKFYHFRIWYRNELAPYVKEVLLDPRALSRPYLNKSHVEKMVASHVTGRGNHTTMIHKLLTSELIHRQLLEQN